MEIKLSDGVKIIPSFIEQKGETCIKDYVKFLQVDDELKNHPERYQTLMGDTDTFTVDCIYFPQQIKDILNDNIDDKAEVERLWKEELQPIWKKLHAKKLEKSTAKRRYQRKVNRNLTQKQLLEVYKDELIGMFGKYKTVHDVREYARNKWGVQISDKNLRLFTLSNKEAIGKLREQWETNYDEFRLTKKRGRLEELSYLYSKNKENFQKGQAVSRSKEMRSILDQVKKEIEGNRIALDINGNIDVNVSLNAAMSMKEIMSKMSINNLILSVIAANTGINPMSLMTQLTQSYYSQANGVGGVLGKQDSIEPPTQLIYDFNHIQRVYKNKETNNVEYTDYQDVDEEVKKKVTSKREELLRKLKG